MNSKPIIFLGMFVGGMIGGYIPLLWGESSFSFSGIFLNAVGAIIGIYFAYKISRD